LTRRIVAATPSATVDVGDGTIFVSMNVDGCSALAVTPVPASSFSVRSIACRIWASFDCA